MLALYLFGVLALTIWVYGLNLWNRFKVRNIPGPRPRWLLSNMQLSPRGKLHEDLDRLARRYGPIFTYFFGRVPRIVISDPELVRQVAVKKFATAFHDRPGPFIRSGGPADVAFLYRSMLIAKGKYWASIRAACEPLFHTKALQSYAPDMNKAMDVMLERLTAAAGSNAAVDISMLLSGMTMDVIGSTAFGVDFKAQQVSMDKKDDSRLLKAAKSLFTPFSSLPQWLPLAVLIAPHFRPVFLSLAKVLGRSKYDDSMNARGYLWGTSSALLHNSQNAHGVEPRTQGPLPPAGSYPASRRGFLDGLKDHANVVPPPHNLMTRLTKAVNRDTQAPFTDTDICSQGFTFLLAGYETTSLALSYAVYALANDLDLQERVVVEVLNAIRRKKQGDAIVDDSNKPKCLQADESTKGNSSPSTPHLSLDDVEKLDLTRSVFLEAMRMWPPVTPLVALTREAHAPVELGGYHLPKGTVVMFNIWSMHHDPVQFPQPDAFRPERHMPGSEEAEKRHPFAFIPFGVGPRKCVGWRFAMAEGVLALARIVATLRLEVDTEHHKGPLDLRSSGTMVPKGGVWVRSYVRDGTERIR